MTSASNPPPDARTSHRVLYRDLLQFQQDFQEHIHLKTIFCFRARVVTAGALRVCVDERLKREEPVWVRRHREAFAAWQSAPPSRSHEMAG